MMCRSWNPDAATFNGCLERLHLALQGEVRRTDIPPKIKKSLNQKRFHNNIYMNPTFLDFLGQP
jgi:hypothetical protein